MFDPACATPGTVKATTAAARKLAPRGRECGRFTVLLLLGIGCLVCRQASGLEQREQLETAREELRLVLALGEKATRLGAFAAGELDHDPLHVGVARHAAEPTPWTASGASGISLVPTPYFVAYPKQGWA
jgi:hypothetical protein